MATTAVTVGDELFLYSTLDARFAQRVVARPRWDHPESTRQEADDRAEDGKVGEEENWNDGMLE